jgi:geranylgeranyl pyrophosphate synthase
MSSSLKSNRLDQEIQKQFFQDLRQIIDSDLIKLTAAISESGLNEQLNYALLSVGKRLRPVLTLLSVGSVGGNLQDAQSLAIAVEVMHTGTLVHDDIIDEDTKRRGVQTVHNRWSVNEAILTGDALLSIAMNLIVDYDREILRLFAETGLQLAEGEHMDLAASYEITENEYMLRIEKKSASLFKASTRCGAIAGKGSPLETAALTSYGENFGKAYQIRDDVLDALTREEDCPQDIKQRRITLPLIHLLNSLKGKEKAALIKRLALHTGGESKNKRAFFKDLQKLQDKNESIDYCKNKINLYVETAIANLDLVKQNIYKTRLVEIANSLRLS